MKERKSLENICTEKEVHLARTEYHAIMLRMIKKGTRPVKRKLIQTAPISESRDCFEPPWSVMKYRTPGLGTLSVSLLKRTDLTSFLSVIYPSINEYTSSHFLFLSHFTVTSS